MIVRHEGTALGTIVYQLVTQQIGLQRTDTVAPYALHLVQRLHQIDELLTRRLTEVADVHTRQHDFLSAFSSSLLGLFHQRRYRRVTAETAGIGNGTIGTKVVAAVLHLQEVACPVTPRTRRGKTLDVLRLLVKYISLISQL